MPAPPHTPTPGTAYEPMTQVVPAGYKPSFPAEAATPTYSPSPLDTPAPPNIPLQPATQIVPAPQPHRPASGVRFDSPMDLVANVESGDRNIPQQIHDINTEKGTPAKGNFQIIDPTWKAHAAKAGVDLNQYPTALGAPRYIQAKVASVIPVNQWGPATKRALLAKYPWINVNGTLGEAQSQAIAGGATAKPNDATATAVPATSGAQDFAEAAKRGDVGGALAALNKGKEGEDGGKGPLGKLGDQLGGKAAPQSSSSPMLPAPSMGDQGAQAQAGQALLGQVLQQGAKPLTWSSQPYGYGLAGPQTPGTTLNSMG